jgi:CO/xanthine dehydrogenase FAD-binding subunit
MDLHTVIEVARPRQRADLPTWRAGDAWLAGGTWLFSEPQPGIGRLIDISELDWPALEISEQGLRIAATCKIVELDSATLPSAWVAAPLFNQCCRSFLASFKIWNMATVGGNVCMALPAGPMISLTAGLQGVCAIWMPNGKERRVAVKDFVLAPQRNVLRPGELLRAIDLPAAALRRQTAFRQISLSPLGRSAVLLIGSRNSEGGTFTITITAATPRPIQLAFAEIPASAALHERIEAEIPNGQYYGDVHGSPAWRRHMTLHFAEQIRRELAGENPA